MSKPSTKKKKHKTIIRCRIQDAGCRMQDEKFMLLFFNNFFCVLCVFARTNKLDAGCKIQDTRCRIQDTGCKMQDARCKIYVIVF
ncbi:MAG: hypothetical protein U9R42_04825 [Bacteroidota bacterium]|nr:hypothetical protein [Bacteroidota bacterium]